MIKWNESKVKCLHKEHSISFWNSEISTNLFSFCVIFFLLPLSSLFFSFFLFIFARFRFRRFGVCVCFTLLIFCLFRFCVIFFSSRFCSVLVCHLHCQCVSNGFNFTNNNLVILDMWSSFFLALCAIRFWIRFFLYFYHLPAATCVCVCVC